jgi:hypothetical protein
MHIQFGRPGARLAVFSAAIATLAAMTGAISTALPANAATGAKDVCVGKQLALTPLKEAHDIGDQAGLVATLTNVCVPVSGATVTFTATAGPNLGFLGTATTNALGRAIFHYTSAVSGTDTVIASTPVLILSNTAMVRWYPNITATGGFTLTGTEGAVAASGTVATFTDPDTTAVASDYSATINWGDAGPTSAGTITGATGGPFTVTGTHTYAEEGTYTISVTITDVDRSTNTATVTSTANIADAALTASGIMPVPGSPQAFNGPVATFTDANTLSTTADFTATINWGDSTPTSTGTVTGSAGNYTVSGTHTYTGVGYYTVTVHIVDDGGKTADATTTVLVGAAGAGGNFVIGYNSEDVGDTATFWGFNWRTFNHVRAGSVPSSFKGWEDQAALPACGSDWTTSPFDSATPPPAAPLPAYIVTIVTDRFRSTSSHSYVGSTAHLVIVKTNPGYRPFPKYTGTGTVVATVC